MGFWARKSATFNCFNLSGGERDGKNVRTAWARGGGPTRVIGSKKMRDVDVVLINLGQKLVDVPKADFNEDAF